MPCVVVNMGKTRMTRMIVNMAPPTRRIVSGGKEFMFEFHEFLGPCMVNKRGDPVSTFPPKRSPFWDALWNWINQGKRVDADGNCIFEHTMQLVYITKQISKRQYLILTARPHSPKIAKLLKRLDETRQSSEG